ncbi:TRAP transporter large permease [Desulfitibacter alkalitolerans]|uniref:TRAP transporter large permease n=1 Tax=Desulfitibacter alkalitolerans TaxID=264641 RepID=UPI000480DB68|nr:TRAP transporter large permease [Desulfitibacter alkalitolerans]
MSAPLVLALTFIVCLLMGVPIAFTIGVATMAALWVGGIPFTFLSQNLFSAVDSFAIMAVPFFILAGALMETGGLSRRLIDVANALVGRYVGGLGMVTILACAFFAAISGSSPATVAAIGCMMIPAMIKKGYNKTFSASVAASGGGLGILIPPSIPMIIYGVVGSVSIGQMFLAGIIPGIIISVILLSTAYFIARKNGYKGSNEPFIFKDFLKVTRDAVWALLAPVIILGGIYGGIFTPTESAVVAVVYGLIVGLFVYKELKWKDIPEVFIRAAMVTGSVIIIVGMAAAFSKLITMYQIPTMLAQVLLGISEHKLVVLALINIVILFAGMFMETLSLIIIFTPLFLPIVMDLGVNPIHFGIILVIGAEIGLMSPPVGVNLFVASGISGVSMEKMSRGILPFILMMIIGLFVITYIPKISLFLPQLLR